MAHDMANLYFSFWAIFSLLPPFSLLTDQKTKIKKMKKKKTLGDIVTFYICVPKIMIT